MTINNESNSIPEFNPFGEKEYGYSPDIDDNPYHVTMKDRAIDWIRIAVIFAVCVVIITLVSNAFVTNDSRKQALEQMSTFNTAAIEMQKVFSKKETTEKFQKAHEDTKLSQDVRDYAYVVTEMSKEMRSTEYKPLTENTTNDEASLTVLPYFATCDAITLMSKSMDTAEYGKICYDFHDKAMDMMQKNSEFNQMKGTIPGFLNPFLGSKLPDVTTTDTVDYNNEVDK